MDLKADAHYVLSGGMGALGMVTAQYLLEDFMIMVIWEVIG